LNLPPHGVAHLARWSGLNTLNKDPQNNKGPSSCGHCNTRDTLSPGDINMEGGLTGPHHQSPPILGLSKITHKWILM
jgi:hypothetical protein